jgi:hypothetical protein
MDSDGNEIAIYESLDSAKKLTNIDDGGIAKCCKGIRNMAGGFKWEYIDANLNEQIVDLTDYNDVTDFPNYAVSKDGKHIVSLIRSF